MKRLTFALAALAAACNANPPAPPAESPPELEAPALPMADAAGNSMEALTETAGRFCTGDGVWCVGDDGIVTRNGQERARIALAAGEDEQNGVWPMIVREGRDDARALVGVTTTRSTMYSGGAAEATRVTLYDVSGAAPVAVLSAPVSGSAMIRACFSEEDQRARLGACHDEYSFASTLALDTAVDAGAPRLALTTLAATYPGPRSRTSDSAEAPPLQQSDLRQARDEACSYRRVANRQGGAYVWDAPLPACADYLEP